jgi:hypothetical protein
MEYFHIHLLNSSFAHCHSLPNLCNYQTVVSITISPSERSDIKYTWMPSPVYQSMIVLVMGLSLRRGPGVLMNVLLVILTVFFRCGLSYPIVGLKHLTCLLSHWNHPTFSYRTCETDKVHVLVPHRSCPLYHRSYPRMGRAHLQQ